MSEPKKCVAWAVFAAAFMVFDGYWALQPELGIGQQAFFLFLALVNAGSVSLFLYLAATRPKR